MNLQVIRVDILAILVLELWSSGALELWSSEIFFTTLSSRTFQTLRDKIVFLYDEMISSHNDVII